MILGAFVANDRTLAPSPANVVPLRAAHHILQDRREPSAGATVGGRPAQRAQPRLLHRVVRVRGAADQFDRERPQRRTVAGERGLDIERDGRHGRFEPTNPEVGGSDADREQNGIPPGVVTARRRAD
ncbi:MAG: hypothetical protein JNK78_01015 [Planctomycetes bacterium]|nr:hypothetical protein [Planctomycetota bacterium]